MPFSASSKTNLRLPLFIIIFLSFSLLTIAQVTLKYRMLTGYLLNDDAPANKGKPTLFVFEQAETFEQVFKPATGSKRPDGADFSREMLIGVTVPPTSKGLKLSISKVFVQDSTLTVRYIRMTDTTANAPQPLPSELSLLLAIPKQTVLKTRLVENGKVIQTIKKRETGE